MTKDQKLDNLMPFEQLGPKICILGCSGSGKSTLAQKLAKKFGLPTYHLDLLAHVPGSYWQRSSDEDLIRAQSHILTQDYWIIEGNYSLCMQERLLQASAVIWLDLNVFICLVRYFKRAWKNDTNRPGRLKNAKNEFSWWLIKHILLKYPKNRLNYKKLIDGFPSLLCIHITSIREIKKYYKFWEIS